MKNLNKDIIVYEDDNIIVVNKPAGLAVQSKKDEETLFSFLQKEISPYIQMTHRIDQVVSGLVIFSKTTPATKKLNELFSYGEIIKTYLALVPKEKSNEAGTIEAYLMHNKKAHKADIIEDPEKLRNSKLAKLSSLTYHKLGDLDNYSLLEVNPNQGRFHQIRALLSHGGIAIKGDVKYGARRKNHDRSIHLHAYQLTIPKQFCGKILQFIAPLPDDALWQNCTSLLPTPKEEF